MCKRRLLQRSFRNIFGNDQSDTGSSAVGNSNPVQSTSNVVAEQINIVSAAEENTSQNGSDCNNNNLVPSTPNVVADMSKSTL